MNNTNIFCFISISILTIFIGCGAVIPPILGDALSTFIANNSNSTIPIFIIEADQTVFDDGVKMFKEKKYSKAFKKFYTLAKKNVASAQYNIAIMYDQGLGVDKNYKKAFKWYLKAARQNNHPSAQFNVGQMYLKGEGAYQSDTKGYKWIHKAAKQEFPQAMHEFGRWLYKENKKKKAFKWLLKAAKEGILDAQYTVGLMYDTGDGVKQNDEKAFEWYFKAATQGYAYGQVAVGGLFIAGRGVAQNDKKGFEWNMKAAEQGDNYGYKNVIALLEAERGVDQHDVETIKKKIEQIVLLKEGPHDTKDRIMYIDDTNYEMIEIMHNG